MSELIDLTVAPQRAWLLVVATLITNASLVPGMLEAWLSSCTYSLRRELHSDLSKHFIFHWKKTQVWRLQLHKY